METDATPKINDLLNDLYRLPLEEFVLCVDALKGRPALYATNETHGMLLECISSFPNAQSLRQTASRLCEEEFKRLMVEIDRRPRLQSKEELLAKYSARELTGFAQFDAWVFWSNAYDDDGFAQLDMFNSVPTNELMVGSDVRVLVRSGVSPDTAVRLLEGIVTCLNGDPTLISRFSPPKLPGRRQSRTQGPKI
jgi:hypothetical protein